MKVMSKGECDAVLSRTGVTFDQLRETAVAYLMTAILQTDAARAENPAFIRAKGWNGEKRNTPKETAELGAWIESPEVGGFAAGLVRMAVTANGPYDGPYARQDNEIVGRILHTLKGGSMAWVRLIETAKDDETWSDILEAVAKSAGLEL